MGRNALLLHVQAKYKLFGAPQQQHKAKNELLNTLVQSYLSCYQLKAFLLHW